ncbi:Hint domain-containing protein [Paracoccus nototheniae]|uniref:Hint domain-containing protein n=1 Tax=Paracoccus nototheniae TaxID=2489002 RepID=UPI0013F3FE71|nr:Hint domain-containing protein [Paracoccus nototheniae]
MANSYNMYLNNGNQGPPVFRFRTGNGPTRTEIGVDDRRDPGETLPELDVLREGEQFFVPTDSGSAEIWVYRGNVTDADTDVTMGFIGSRTTTSGETRYALFTPESDGELPVSPRRVFVNIDNLDTESGWQIDAAEPFCFVTGTQIATPAGARAVETLAIGDEVLTADGRSVAIRWMGHQLVHPRAAGPRPSANRLPVRIAAGALGRGLPLRDLMVSADHALVVDGLLVNAGVLVNGTTITIPARADLPAQFTYYHIETEAHDEVLAEGVAAETFIDYAARRAFDNYQEYLDLYGSERIIPEMSRPRISAARQLPRALAQRLGIADFAKSVTAESEALMQRLTAA